MCLDKGILGGGWIIHHGSYQWYCGTVEIIVIQGALAYWTRGFGFYENLDERNIEIKDSGVEKHLEGPCLRR